MYGRHMATVREFKRHDKWIRSDCERFEERFRQVEEKKEEGNSKPELTVRPLSPKGGTEKRLHAVWKRGSEKQMRWEI